jgi:hypothetical protein
MALSTPYSGAASRERWLVPAHVTSLALVYAGERVFAASEVARPFCTAVGVLGAVGTTAALWMARRAASSTDVERGRIASALATFATLGVLGLALYAATTDVGMRTLGLATLAPETRVRVRAALTAGWILAILCDVVPLAFGERAVAPMRSSRFFDGRRVQAALTAGLTLALAAGYTSLFVYAASYWEAKLDFSFFRAGKPSESTVQVAANLPEPVRVIAFFPPANEVATDVRTYLGELRSGAPKLEVEFYDRLLEPGLAKDAKVSQDGVVVLYRGTQREAVTIGADPKTANPKLKTLDQDFQKALMKVMRPQRTAYLTVGHGEVNEGAASAAEGRTAKNLRRVLESQNYLVKDLGLGQGLGDKVPSDAYLVAVLGPTRALLDSEVKSIATFFDGGGKLLLALDPDGKADLAPLARVAGLSWKSTTLAGEKSIARRRYDDSDHAILVTTRYSSHASVSTLSRNAQKAPVFLPGAAALDKLEGAPTDLRIDFAVKTPSDVFADENGNFKLDEGEKKSTYQLAAAVARGDKGAVNEARAFVLGDADALSDLAFSNEPNVVLALDALRWLGGEESFAGQIAPAQDVTIEHTKQKDLLWFYGVIFLGPGAVVGAGLVASRRKRKPGERSAGRRGGEPVPSPSGGESPEVRKAQESTAKPTKKPRAGAKTRADQAGGEP